MTDRSVDLATMSKEAIEFHRAAVDARLHVWEGMWHSFEWYADIPEAEESLDEIANFLSSQLG